ncbi:expressed conserved protein [Plakobranchus ocellatus]|uniref:Glycerophosphocholine acyltransferase 1 n=1 Tax=Plakobranchus ocellatus TaxID=259542 RepID=A0AAV4AVF3_9GAST|nr:expressed conserved protein [Plakobranchus ocellatus]
MEVNLNNYQELLEAGERGDILRPQSEGLGPKHNKSTFIGPSVVAMNGMELNREKTKNEINDLSFHSKTVSNDIKMEEMPAKDSNQSSFALKHMQDFYDTVAEMTVEPTTKDEPDVKAFFKVLRKHRLQSKITYVLTVAGIVLTSHCVLTDRWLMPYLYSVLTPSLLFFRLIMYWKMKYQYFMLDFCYFANIYCFTYLWVAPSHENMFAVGFSIASGPLIWALLIFRNSLVLHSLDKVTSLYIHLMPCLLTFVIRWYPEETSSKWHKPFPKCQLQFNFLWLVVVPMAFHVSHQVIYFILVNLILKPSQDYLNLFRYVTRNEKSLQFRLCNLFGPRYRIMLYTAWSLLMVLCMLFLVPLWYNYFIADCIMLVFFLVTAAFNGATYYVDVFSLEGSDRDKSKLSKSDVSSNGSNAEHPEEMGSIPPLSQTVVTCSADGDKVETRTAPNSQYPEPNETVLQLSQTLVTCSSDGESIETKTAS